jgi:hypothetical protein
MVNMTVVLIVVLMVNVFMVHGHVMALKTVMTVLMKLTVLLAVLMINLTVVMANVLLVHGHVTAMVTVLMAQMKLIVLLHHVKIKVWLPVMMANVYQHLIIVMDQLIPVTQDGVLTVQMAQMKV